jgi:hypothetical protein
MTRSRKMRGEEHFTFELDDFDDHDGKSERVIVVELLRNADNRGGYLRITPQHSRLRLSARVVGDSLCIDLD